jgi:phosphoglycolate phosphatase
MNLVIFDFEGTLVDFQWQLRAALDDVYPRLEDCIAAAGLDREMIARADYCRLYNYLQKNISDPALAAETMKRVDEVFDYYDANAARRWHLYPDVHDLLEELKTAGWGLALDSNVGRLALDRMLDKFSLHHYFDMTVSRNEVSLLKPEVDGLHLIRSYYQSKSADIAQTFMVGDSVTDIETAHNAGIKVAILVNGEDKTERLRQHKPNYLIENLTELKEIFSLH